MNTRCENCGHMALETDTNCWHCGEPLPGRQDAGGKKIKARESWSRDAEPGSLTIFAGLTLLVAVAALLVTSALANRPQLQVRLGTRVPDDWTFITPADDLFTVSLPESWMWLDASDPVANGTFSDQVEAEPRFRLATHPLGAEIDDLSVRFLAEGDQPASENRPFMIVAASPRLNRLTYQEIISFLVGTDYDLQDIRFVEDFDKSHVSIVVNTPINESAGDMIRCRQQFVLGREVSLLGSLCATEDAYPAFASQFDQIMATFQHLET